jgi:hypothetical protein
MLDPDAVDLDGVAQKRADPEVVESKLGLFKNC